MSRRTPRDPLASLAITEAQWQRTVVDLLRLRGWNQYHTYDSRRSSAGFPDLVCCHPVYGLLFLELKRESGRTTADQESWHASLRAAGQRVYVLRPSDWPTAQRLAAGEGVSPGERLAANQRIEVELAAHGGSG